MNELTLSSALLYLLAWISVTAIVSTMLNHLSKHAPLPPTAWWAGLLSTLLVFVPLPFSVQPVSVTFSWFTPALPLPAGEQAGAAPALSDVLFGSSVTPYVVLTLLALFSLWRVCAMLRNHWRLHKLIAQSIPFQPVQAVFPTYLTPFQSSAFATGILRPIVALPDYFLSLPEGQQRIVLAHEYNHIRQRDPLALFIWRLLCEMCWFNPLLGRLERGFVQSAEYRCDRRTLQAQACSPTTYAKALLACLKQEVRTSAHRVSPLFVSGMTAGDYKKRLQFIMTQRTSKPNKLHVTTWVALLFTAIFCTHSTLAALAYAEEDWQFPVLKPKLSSPFGHVSTLRENKAHRGIDLMGPAGTPIYASASGIVVIAGDDSLSKAYGTVIVLQHPNHWQSLYAHLSEVRVKPGEAVSQGELIGLMGQTGRATGPHLHFEIAHRDQAVDPLVHLRANQTRSHLLP